MKKALFTAIIAVFALIPGLLFAAASLTATVSAAPVSAPLGSMITVSVTVNNTGDIAADTVGVNSIAMQSLGGSATMMSVPTPAVITIAAGASHTFTYTYSADSTGILYFEADASGYENGTGTPLSTAILNSTNISIYDPNAVKEDIKIYSNVIRSGEKNVRLSVAGKPGSAYEVRICDRNGSLIEKINGTVSGAGMSYVTWEAGSSNVNSGIYVITVNYNGEIRKFKAAIIK